VATSIPFFTDKEKEFHILSSHITTKNPDLEGRLL
jgi:predicted FMN-binding regulatory protein PaiB